MAIAIGSRAPQGPGVDVRGPHAVIFYKVTCSVAVMAAPALGRLAEAYTGAVIGVGQDPQADLDRFATGHAWSFAQIPDLAPYVTSDAYGIASSPTVVVVDGGGVVADVVESWDRDRLNAASGTLAGLLGVDARTVSSPDDGLPTFKPG